MLLKKSCSFDSMHSKLKRVSDSLSKNMITQTYTFKQKRLPWQLYNVLSCWTSIGDKPLRWPSSCAGLWMLWMVGVFATKEWFFPMMWCILILGNWTIASSLANSHKVSRFHQILIALIYLLIYSWDRLIDLHFYSFKVSKNSHFTQCGYFLVNQVNELKFWVENHEILLTIHCKRIFPIMHYGRVVVRCTQHIC